MPDEAQATVTPPDTTPFTSIEHHEEIRSQFCAVLTRYGKTFHDKGIDANLNEWAKNKSPLIDLLRKHPKWDEKAKAVVIPFIEKLDANCVKAVSQAATILDKAQRRDIIGYTKLCNLRSLFDRILVQENVPTIQDDSLNSLSQGIAGVAAPVGMKITRLMQAIFEGVGITESSDYQQDFAPLADYISPDIKNRKAMLSVHPCDFLEMSNKDNTWSSCFTLKRGQQSASTLAYMNDDVSMVFSVIAANAEAPLYAAPKKRRTLVSFDDGRFVMSRLYPDAPNVNCLREDCVDAIKGIMATCTGNKNRWKTFKSVRKINAVVRKQRDSFVYSELDCAIRYPRMAEMSKYQHKKLNMFIGAPAYCIDCAERLVKGDRLSCPDCEGDRFVMCDECGKRVQENHLVFNYTTRRSVCLDCYKKCAHCPSTTNLVKITDDTGSTINVCPHCMEDYVACPICGRLKRFRYGTKPTTVGGPDSVCARCIHDIVERAIEERKCQIQQNLSPAS